MKKQRKKSIFFSIFLPMILVISGYEILELISKSSNNAAPKVESQLFEILPNGESKLISTRTTVPEKTVKLLMQKQSEIEALIAEQTNLTRKEVLAHLAASPHLDDPYNLTCSVVLNTMSTFNDEILNKVVEAIVNSISHFPEYSVDAHILRENITISNANGVSLQPQPFDDHR